MSAKPNAPVVGAADGTVALDPAVFGAEVKPHLVHETVRAEMAERRAGTRAVKTRGLVAGGGAKPWRQKGTGRARVGSIRTVHWTGGGAAFPPRTSFAVKVNKKVRRSALRAALSAHARGGTLAVLPASSFSDPSTSRAVEVLRAWGKETPTLVVAQPEEETVVKSFRNLERVAVTAPGELEVGALVWARSLLVTEQALARLQEVAS